MSRKKLRIHNTKVDNLVSNLRGEIGEIIFTWVLLRNIIAESQELAKSKSEYDFSDPHFATLKIMIDKLSDEIVARLSELAETKIGRLTFYFAHQKLNKFAEEVEDFSRFIRINRLEEKRNVNISHKELPETQSEQKYIFISYETLIKGLAKALRLMKKIDFVMLGPSTKYLWKEMRKRRYLPLYPVKSQYMLLPYLNLSKEDRMQIIIEEIELGKDVWTDINTQINDVESVVKACKEWGAVILGSQILLLDNYPLNDLESIKF